MSTIRKNTLTFPALMNEIFKPDWFGGIENTTAGLPPVNIKENEKDYQLQLAVPGLKKEDFSIEVDANVLTISTEIASDNE